MLCQPIQYDSFRHHLKRVAERCTTPRHFGALPQ